MSLMLGHTQIMNITHVYYKPSLAYSNILVAVDIGLQMPDMVRHVATLDGHYTRVH